MPALPAIPPSPPAAFSRAWGSLQLVGETNSFRQSLDFSFVQKGRPGAPGATHWWVLHRIRQPNPSLREEAWVDGRACLGLDAAMRMLFSAAGPRFSDPGDPEAARLTRHVADGTDFVLEAEGSLPADPPSRTTSARVRIASNDMGDLEPWYAQLTLTTQACWKDSPPAA